MCVVCIVGDTQLDCGLGFGIWDLGLQQYYLSSTNTQPAIIDQIERDLHRTMPTHYYFSEDGGPGYVSPLALSQMAIDDETNSLID